ncbi:MAG: DUF4293 family protein [Bacteroidota bacterium]
MLQRIQSIWLLLISICIFSSLKIAYYTGNIVPEGELATTIKTFTQLNGMYNIVTNILTVTIGVLSLITIFLYSNRKLQLKLIFVGILLEILLLVEYQVSIKKFTEGSIAIGSMLQFLVLLFFYLAIKGIRKDNKIIAESDRLR